MNAGAEILLIAVCILGNAFFAGLETGIIAINRLRLRHLVEHRVPGARILERFLSNPEVLFGTTLIGTNICQVTVAVVSTSLMVKAGFAGAPVIAGVAATVVILVFGEYLPKAWFQGFPSHRTLPFARALLVASWILYPLRWALAALLRLITGDRLSGPESQPMITREEFLHLAREGGETGTLSPVETRMIKGVMQIGGTRCRDIMIPIDRMARIDASTSIADLLDLARRKELSRFPVWDSAMNRFTGVVNVFDVLADGAAEGRPVADFMRHPQFVSAHTQADHVMPRMRVTRQPLMLVTDEAGGVIGVVTLTDVLNVIVGPESGTAAPAPTVPS